MADQPSGVRNFFGRVVDRVLPGSNYNTTTGQYSNVGTGLAGLGARLIATSLAGPAAGALVGKAAGYLIDRNGNRIGPVQREAVNGPGATVPGYSGSVTMPSQQNLGLGAQRPGGNWYGYTGGPGSMGSFGNTQFGNGMASVGQWSPQSVWGQQVAAPAGSNLDLGNNVGGFIGGSGSGSGGSMGGSNAGYGSVASNLGLTRGGGASGGWQTASNWSQLLGRFSGDPEMYTQAI
ncbi:hypothetical protein PWE35_09335 [Stenotrophomonas maltophilia]|uniref:hypothetical protein n=1 Tax=Stenotrophomonas maltophilia TaxID=40324 RepID=UPI00237F28E3|nr:hypothetical protein [Stenotrophomonas maltophilia]WDW06026.1 hypothetical protein PWE35_09335 [Stenotrophomonas maltophilia]